ncbi:MAG: hypothetical protein ACI92I_000587, partial [Acidimicrobiales bacterium]
TGAGGPAGGYGSGVAPGTGAGGPAGGYGSGVAPGTGAGGPNAGYGSTGGTTGGGTGTGKDTGAGKSAPSKGFFGRALESIISLPGKALSGFQGMFSGLFSGKGSSDDTFANLPQGEGPDATPKEWAPSGDLDLNPQIIDIKTPGTALAVTGQTSVYQPTCTSSSCGGKTGVTGNTDVKAKSSTSSRPKNLANKKIQNLLLIDLGCDTTIDIQKSFSSSLPSLRNKNENTLDLQYNTSILTLGNHCLAIKVDVDNDIEEASEKNNTTDWYSFTIGATTPADDPVVTIECPIYNQPICASDEYLMKGGIGANGCQLAPQCLQSTAEVSDILFEVKSYTDADEIDGRVGIQITTKSWSSDDIVLRNNEELMFRWNAPGYEKCLTYIHPVKYNWGTGITSVSGNTEESNIDIQELTAIYSIECTTGSVTHKKLIDVAAN